MGRRLKKKSIKLVPRRAEGPLPTSLLALDVSSVCVGWAIFHGADLHAGGKFLLPNKADHGEKLIFFASQLLDLLNEYDPECLCVETPFHGRQRFAYGILMMYIGQVLHVHYAWYGSELPKDARLPAHYIKRVLGVPHVATHAERKRQMVKHINHLYELNLRYKAGSKDVSDDDVADAIACGHAYLARWTEHV